MAGSVDSSHANYNSNQYQRTMLEECANVTRDEMMIRLNASENVAVILDETQDVSNVSQLIFYYKILFKGKPETHYAGIHALPRGDVS